MSRIGSLAPILLLAALGALLLAAPASAREAETEAATDPYWLGPYYAGLRLTHLAQGSDGTSLAYGDCELPEGEGGCAPPLEVQSASSCSRNPVGLDTLPYKLYRLRGGGIAAAYVSTWVDVGTGNQTVTVFTTEYELTGAALRDLHRKSQAGPEPLAPPVYPMPVLRELKRVTVAAAHLHGIGAISRATGISPGRVEVRLRLAELLGPDALADVPVPTMSAKTVRRLRQLAFLVMEDGLARTARREGISKAALQKKIRRVRGLVGDC